MFLEEPKTTLVEVMPDGSVRIIRHGIRLASEPRLVTTTPTYLNYLYQSPQPVERPNPLGLPVSGTEEVAVWKAGVKKGWEQGVIQADRSFDRSLALLRRDFDGMLRYIDMVNRGVLSAPKLMAETQTAFVSSDGKQLNIGDVVVRIDHKSNFQHISKWEVLSSP